MGLPGTTRLQGSRRYDYREVFGRVESGTETGNKAGGQNRTETGSDTGTNTGHIRLKMSGTYFPAKAGFTCKTKILGQVLVRHDLRGYPIVPHFSGTIS